jgi:two-component system, NarL family, sensor histidine kinase NreB
VERGRLRLTLRDNGRGFDPAAAHDGHGLVSLRGRARGLGGQLEISSSPGQGTTVILSVALAGPGPFGTSPPR